MYKQKMQVEWRNYNPG